MGRFACLFIPVGWYCGLLIWIKPALVLLPSILVNDKIGGI